MELTQFILSITSILSAVIGCAIYLDKANKGRIAGIKADNERNIAEIKKESERNIAEIKKESERNIAEIRKESERNIAEIKKESERNIAEIKKENERNFIEIHRKIASLQENNNKNRLEDMRFYLHNLMKSAPENAEFIQHLFHTYKELGGNGLVEENYYERKRNYTK